MLEDPITTAERMAVAKKFVVDSKIEIPTLLDKVDDAVGKAYASHPDRLYLIGKDGKIAFAGAKGPQGFKPNLLEKAVLAEIGR